MRLPKRDLIATVLVALAVVLYLLWLLDATLPAMSDVRVTGLVILALGFAASASAVVPAFEALLHGNRTYLMATTVLGLVAFAGGLTVVMWESGAGLAVLVGSMVVLWAIATTRHVRLASRRSEPATPQPTAPRQPQPTAPRQRHLTSR